MSYLSFGEAELDWERRKFAPPPWCGNDSEEDGGTDDEDWFGAYKEMRDREELE